MHVARGLAASPGLHHMLGVERRSTRSTRAPTSLAPADALRPLCLDMSTSIRRSAIALSIVSMASCRAATLPAPAPAAPAAAPAVTTAVAGPTLPAPDPSRFQQDVLLEGVFDEPTEIAVARDGRVFIAERPGTVSVYEPATHRQRTIARLTVDFQDENGLIGIALDPGFEQNHWLYLNYSRPDEHFRLARFTLDGDSLSDGRALLGVKFDKGCCHT